MASFAKSSRGRRPPFPKNKNMAAKNDDTFSKYMKESPRNEIEDSSTVGEMDSDDEAPTRDTASPTKTGVAYLTENLIKRLTKEENVAQVTTLHVTLGKELNKKIKYIENLENVRKLLHLSLNNHMIVKIEKLDHLTQLRELHLANNRISKIEGLDLLVHLTVLNLNGNLIKNLPAPLFKKLKELQTFHIAHNQLRSLIEVTKLRPLQDLSSFSLEGNPMASMEHSWQFVIFQLRSLKLLDGKKITEDDRQMADERFAQEEVRRLEEELFRQKKDFHTLQEEKQQALEELQQLKKLLSEQQVLSLDQSQKVKELHQQLEAKEELLASKTAELSKACEKQFKLEQELAFYKLDAKFEHLGMLPPPDLEFEDGEDDESPYIGKARFKPNKFTRKSNIASGEQHAEVTTMGSRPSDRYHDQNRQVQQELHDSLIFDLHNKERAIEQAEEVLAQLNDQLNKRKAQVQDAGDKLAQIQQAIVDQAQLLGEEERKLIDAIAEKKNYIRKLQQVSKELEDRMRNTADDMRQREAETEKLRQTVRNTPQTDPAYSHLQTRLAAKEQQLLQLQDEYGKLKQDHDRARARLEEEIAAVKDLEAQLATLRKANSDQDKLKEELKNIIDDLNDNLNSMKQQVAQQAKQISQLQHEKDALGQKLKAMQTQSANNKQLKDNIAQLQQQLKLNEDALERERKNCEALRRRLSDFEAKAAQGSSVEPALADAKKRLHDAEAEVARLQNALNKLKQQLQGDRRAADERLKKEQDKVSRALQAARSAGDKDREMKELAAQISALTKDNASLAERLKDAENELRGLENLLDKEEVLERLAELKGDINRRRSAVREPYSNQDDLGRAIRELHQKYIDLMGELEKERRKQPNGEVEGLQARLQDAERALRQAKDRASQLAGDKNQQDAKLRQMADELKRLRDKLGRQEDLEDELENAKAEHAEEMSGLERQIAQLKDQLLKAKHGVQDQLANARAPLQAKIRDMEDEMQYLQDKLEKVKADNEKLKGAIKSVEAGREDLQDRLSDMKEKLREARAQADEANARHDLQKQLLEDKVKALENELERARNRLQSLRAQAEERLQAEKEKAAAKIDGLEEEIDGLKSRLRRLQDKADQELDRMRDAGARQVRDLEGKMADLRNQLDNERVRADEQLRKARNKEAGLKNLLGETQAQLERTSHQSHAQQAKLQELENEIDGLTRALKEAETQALKDKLNKELEAAHAERMKMAIEAAADKQLAEAQQQISSLQSLLADKDRQLQEQLTQGTQNASDIAAQRAEIRNLASALAEQNDELERLNDDLTQMSRGPVHTQYLHNPDPSLTALAGEVEALRAALSQKEQQVANLTSPIHVPVHPPFASTLVTTPGLMPTQPPFPQMTISGLATTPGVVPSQAYVPQFTTSALATTPVLVPSHTYVPVVATSSMATTPAAIFTQTYVPSAVPGPAQEVVSGTSATRTVPAVSTLVTSPGGPSSPEQVHLHHHHHYVSRKSPRGVRKPKAVTLTTSTHLSPELLSASTVTPPVSSVRHHHHHYDDVSGQDGDAARRKKRKSKKRQQDVLFCNFPNHEGLEYEVGRLGGLLSSSLQAQKFQDSRDSLRMNLKDLENEVETSLKRRAASKLSRGKRHSLDGNLARLQDHLLTVVDHKSRLSSSSLTN